MAPQPALSLLLGSSYSLQLPNVKIPVIGDTWLIGILFLSHIVIASFSMGVVVLTPTYELVGKLRHDARFERYAYSVAHANIKLFGLGATLGAFAVFALTGLYPHFFISLLTLFFWPVLIAFATWFVTIPALLVYTYRWNEISVRAKWAHVALGYLGGASEQTFLFFIVGLDSYMLTPGQGFGRGAFFNPSYWPELLHRFVGNMVWASFFIAAVMIAYGALRTDPADRAYHRWGSRASIVVGLLLLIPQVILGFLFAESIKAASPGAFEFSFTGPMAWMWLLQEFLLGFVLLGTNVFFWQSRHQRSLLGGGLTVTVGILSALTVVPESVYPSRLFWVRYVFLAAALLLTLVHLALWRPWHRAPRPELNRGGRWLVGSAGVVAVMLFLLMGVIRTTARGDYTVYGHLKQPASQGIFQAPNGQYYP
ncbi:MAG: cytochrome ubiquinol oxidase subunit I [Candidatus Dormibacteraceae bacterium]